MKANIDTELAWYVATFKPRKAGKALRAIHDLGIGVYLPRKRKDRWHKKAGVRIEYEVPLIAPYIFVGFRPGSIIFQAVDDLAWIGGFIRNAERSPLRVPAKAVEAIFIAETNGEYDETDRARKARQDEAEQLFPPGSAVKLLDDLRGLLAGFDVGTVIESKRNRRHVEFGGLKTWIDIDKLDEVA